MGRRTVNRNNSRTAFCRDGISGETLAVGDIPDIDGFVFENTGCVKKILVNVTYSRTTSLKMSELTIINEYIRKYTGNGITMKKNGLGIDNRLEDGEICVTVLATGFKINNTPPSKMLISTDNGDTVELGDTGTEDEGKVISLSAGSTDSLDENLRELDTKNIFYYEPGCNLSDLQNETALARRERLRRQRQD